MWAGGPLLWVRLKIGWGMALSYLSCDRDQLFLLPPDMGEWLPRGHLVHLVIEVVDRVDTSALHARHPNDGAGRAAYDPNMMLALLVYSYCMGVRSSRQIERLCEVDVAYRVLAANRAPDHTTIARFRQGHQDHTAELFIDVLVLCAEAGLARLGAVALDGTKITAVASLRANRTRDQLEAEVHAMLADAERTDEAEDRLFGDARGDELPDELADPRRRGPRLDAALRQLEAERAARGAEVDAARVAHGARRAEAARRGHRPPGRPPQDPDPVTEAEADLIIARHQAAARARRRADTEARAATLGRRAPGPTPRPDTAVHQAEQRLADARTAAQDRQGPRCPPEASGQPAQAQRGPERAKAKPASEEPVANTSDPDSRIMATQRGWLQGYNAQAAVNETGLVIAGMVTQHHNDVGLFDPMTAAIRAAIDAASINDELGTLLCDAGYWSEHNATTPGPDRLIATGKAYTMRKDLRRQGHTTGPPPETANVAETMAHRLRTEEGSRLYAKRATTVEPVFGQHKEARGFRRFMRKGLTAVNAEWELINTTHNILKLHRHRLASG